MSNRSVQIAPSDVLGSGHTDMGALVEACSEDDANEGDGIPTEMSGVATPLTRPAMDRKGTFAQSKSGTTHQIMLGPTSSAAVHSVTVMTDGIEEIESMISDESNSVIGTSLLHCTD